MIRHAKWDLTKSLEQAQRDHGKICKVPGCGQPLTSFQGPGCRIYCRDHQVGTVNYGGLGTPGAMHSHHRRWLCDWCGYDPREDPRFDRITNPAIKFSAQRACLIGDHKERKADGGLDTEDNIQTLCNVCNNIKTMMNGDTIAASKKSSNAPK
jgi:hypothetical protein